METGLIACNWNWNYRRDYISFIDNEKPLKRSFKLIFYRQIGRWFSIIFSIYFMRAFTNDVDTSASFYNNFIVRPKDCIVKWCISNDSIKVNFWLFSSAKTIRLDGIFGWFDFYLTTRSR